ncbi:ATP-binding protein [Micromonospora aurantiaca (nom. illeg.)]|uniref:ATP-binding protein n=1 Tax=Micromonospora aurantiaca (nom. illeg.) TaxID=47850 RepID=UPI00340ECEEB
MIGASLPREPFRALVGNLAWTHDGTVWAMWHIDPVPYQYAATEDKTSYARLAATLLRALRGEPLLLSLCGPISAAETVARGLRTVHRASHPVYVEIADGYLDLVDQIDTRERSYWLALPLPHPTGLSAAGTILASASGRLGRAFGLTPALPDLAEIRQRAAQAAKVARAVPGLRPASPDEVLWIHRRAARRGTATEPTLASVRGGRRTEVTARGGQLRTRSFASLGEVHLDEGGRLPDPDAGDEEARASGLSRLFGSGPAAPRSPFGQRYVKVTTPDGGVSYQAFLVLADLPEEWVFPGGEWLAALDEDAPFPIDWAIRARITPGAEAKIRVGRKRRQLADQVGEFAPGDNEDAGLVDALPSWVMTGQRQLADEHAALDANSAEVEYQATVVLAVWGDTLDDVEDKAEMLRATFSDDLVAVRPTGDQIACYASMLPGVTAGRVCEDYAQYLLADDLARAMPFVGGRLGDHTGQVLGITVDAGTIAPVQLHLADWTRRDISASLGLFAELGAGKSVTLKKILADVGAAGGRTIGWDRTRVREQVQLLSAVFGTDQVQVADLAAPTEWSLDPLRVLPGPAGAQAAETFLAQLLAVEATSERGTVLAEAIHAVADTPTRSMAALIEYLAGYDVPGAGELARQIRAAARRPGTAVVFDPALPPLDLSAPHVVFATSGMSMPKRHELRSERQMATLPFAALFGRAVLTLTALIARTIAFDDPRFVLVHADECYWLTREGEGSPGYDVVLELIRDGRKNHAGILLAGHDPDDTGDPVLLGLLSAILAGRQRNPRLAARYVSALGVTDPHVAARLTRVITDGLSPLAHSDAATGDPAVEPGREGEFVARLHHRLGKIKVLIPPVDRIERAIRTTPEPETAGG